MRCTYYVIHQQGWEVKGVTKGLLSLHIPPPIPARDRDNLPPTSRRIAPSILVRINYINTVCFFFVAGESLCTSKKFKVGLLYVNDLENGGLWLILGINLRFCGRHEFCCNAAYHNILKTLPGCPQTSESLAPARLLHRPTAFLSQHSCLFFSGGASETVRIRRLLSSFFGCTWSTIISCLV